ncbi:hypothetical protein CALVIDRAFT_526762 [Calocera viscosa TUFC12733]|uniref:Uncharacterized protein n=1 Tax=Calocera viscosa (strain TUFC12733) TaxID=1330018 RepID=A0A167NFS0_CALVF|nr:hypothetical protein CALVIDRAFT_526762 [Calocera viscosa TUFC12733]
MTFYERFYDSLMINSVEELQSYIRDLIDGDDFAGLQWAMKGYDNILASSIAEKIGIVDEEVCPTGIRIGTSGKRLYTVWIELGGIDTPGSWNTYEAEKTAVQDSHRVQMVGLMGPDGEELVQLQHKARAKGAIVDMRVGKERARIGNCGETPTLTWLLHLAYGPGSPLRESSVSFVTIMTEHAMEVVNTLRGATHATDGVELMRHLDTVMLQPAGRALHLCSTYVKEKVDGQRLKLEWDGLWGAEQMSRWCLKDVRDGLLGEDSSASLLTDQGGVRRGTAGQQGQESAVRPGMAWGRAAGLGRGGSTRQS